jgi:diaminopimelate epimerase
MNSNTADTLEIGKLSGAGNDFILIDNRKGDLPMPVPKLAQRLCHRRKSIGADGLLLVEPSKKAHFKILYFNSDGSSAALCLNGARCAARFAFQKVIASRTMKIETEAGVYGAEIFGTDVRLAFPPYPVRITGVDVRNGPAWLVDVGVPHLIIPADGDLFRMEHFVEEARALRFHPALAPGGANVNFAAVLEPGVLAMRTYERGIEDEVLSCSSGSWAALCALAKAGTALQSPLRIVNAAETPLTFEFETAHGELSRLQLTGEARLIFLGRVQREAWDWGA